MERNYVLDIDKIHVACIAFRNFHNAPSSNDRKELDIYFNKKAVMNPDELKVFYDCVKWAYSQGLEDGYREALKDEDENV